MILTCLGAIVLMAALSPVLARHGRSWLGPMCSLTLAGVGVALATQIGSGLGGAGLGEGGLVTRTAWVPDLGVDLAWRLDGLSLTFGLLISFIAAGVMLHAGSYMKSNAEMGRFFATLMSFSAAMLGLVTAENVLLIFVFWELTSLTSYLLVGFEDRREGARWAARQALLVTGVGGLALLAGLILLGTAAGSYEVGGIIAGLGDGGARGHWGFVPGVALVIAGCFSKSAIFPLHFWLPNAMEAPSPVSALLHSSTMVKAGVYLLMRLNPAMGGVGLWEWALTGFGAFTMVYAAYQATRRDDLKKILAFTTVSSLGILTMLVGQGAAGAAAAYLVAHALFKACLFLVAGSVIKSTGVKYSSKLGGLSGVMPVAGLAALVGGLSLAGVPPLMGFAGKELVLKAATHGHGALGVALSIAVVGMAAMTVYAAYAVAWRPFRGVMPDGLHAKPIPAGQLAGPVVLAVMSVVLGLMPQALGVGGLIRGAAASIDPSYDVGGMHLSAAWMLGHPSLPLLLSAAALGGGFMLWRWRERYAALGARLTPPGWLSADRAYDAAVSGVVRLTEAQTRALQNGSLRSYTRTVLVGVVLMVAPALLRYTLGPTGRLGELVTLSTAETGVVDWLLGGLIAASATVAVFQRKMLSAVAVLGTVGSIGAAVFLLYGAPDVAMTQLAVETLVLIIFVLVVYHMPSFSRLTGPGGRAVDGVIAACVGLTMGLFTLTAAGLDMGGAFPPISAYHAANSVSKGHGHNVINMILVDARGFDTMGEITVLGAAAVGLFTLLRPPSRRLVVRPGRAEPAGGGVGGGSLGGGR